MVPWSDDTQVEHDLVLSRALVEIYRDPNLARRLVLRGGTAIQKLHVSPPARFSEDIDLVQIPAEPIGETIDALRARLDPWLGNPRRKLSEGRVTLLYRFEIETFPAQSSRLKIEINTREHFSVYDLEQVPFVLDNPWFQSEARVTVFALDELFGTKLRALYQRKKGRDLFDLWLALERNLIDPTRVLWCFRHYMEHAGTPVSRAVFEANLAGKVDEDFHQDIRPLLGASVEYDSDAALALVLERLISRLPGKPWQGRAEE